MREKGPDIEAGQLAQQRQIGGPAFAMLQKFQEAPQTPLIGADAVRREAALMRKALQPVTQQRLARHAAAPVMP